MFFYMPCLSVFRVHIDPIHLTVFTVHDLCLRLVHYTKPPLCDKLIVLPSTLMLMATTRTFKGSSHLPSPDE